jgi:hypothetical protein
MFQELRAGHHLYLAFPIARRLFIPSFDSKRFEETTRLLIGVEYTAQGEGANGTSRCQYEPEDADGELRPARP